MNHSVLQEFKNKNFGMNTMYQIIHTVGLGETEIASQIEPVMQHLFEYVSIAYLPSLGQVKLRVTGRNEDSELLKNKLNESRQLIESKISNNIIGYGHTSLEKEVGLLLKNRRISTAESCTGGYLAHRITSVEGSSDYYMGSLIAYHNEIKRYYLKVPEEILKNYGAVSEECIRAMITGACTFFKTDYAIATCGIAGPGGGTKDKPVGTVWIACGTKDNIVAKKFAFTRDRIRNIELSATWALIMFWKFLKTESHQDHSDEA
jgi:nicotinamide-nucleotide amidase